MRNDEVNKKDFPEENFSSGRRIFFSYFSSSYFLQKGINICKIFNYFDCLFNEFLCL